MTGYDTKVSILAELMRGYRDDPALKEFMEFSDIGMPLAYFIDEGICVGTQDGKRFILQTWDDLMENLGANDDEGFRDLQHLFDSIS